MIKRISSCVLAGALFMLPMSAAKADEGMFLLDAAPVTQLQSNYDFTLTQDWLDSARLAAVRFNNGGSGGFISPDGLVITNHHIADETLSMLSTKQRNLLKTGFTARSRAEEAKSPNLELNCLQSTEDVTQRVNAAVKPGMNASEANAARRAIMSKIEKESLEATGLRSDIVTLYQGGRYHLYRYKKYTDVRLVWAPEQAIASFGGDIDNFEYPRRSLDAAFFRVYENGQPVHPQHYFKFSTTGVSEGDLVFVIGHPGTTNRQDTVARLKHYRDHLLPYRLARVRTQEAALQQYSERGSEQAMQAESDIHSLANSRKAYTGQFRGLLNANVIESRQAQEQSLQAQSHCMPAWQQIAQCEDELTKFGESYYLLEQRDAVPSELYRLARHLVRMAYELEKPNSQRSREYRDSNLESLRMDLFADEPIYANLEKAKLTAGLSFLAERLGGEHPDTTLVLQGKSPDILAGELVDGCHLFSSQERQRLASGGRQAIETSNDTMIKLALRLEARSKELTKKYETLVKEPELAAYAQIAQERFRIEGASVPPDATFTLRLSYGVVKGYEAEGQQVPWCTQMGDAYKVCGQMEARPPYALPQSWLAAEQYVNKATPFVFVATSDTIGGNSGSPVLNRAGQIVGVNFDRNQYGMVRNFIYDEKQARHMSVSTQAILEALNNVYDAKHLTKEILQ